jgi:RNA polymerase sigma factor (sigma-70 family)
MVLTDKDREVVSENHNLIYWYLNLKGLDVDEWYDLLAIELCKTIVKHDESLGSLANYFKIRCDGIVSKEFRKRNAKKRYHVPVEYADECNGELIDFDLIALEQFIENSNCDVLKLKFQGYSQKEIAEIIGISQSQVSRILGEIRGKLTIDG